MGIGNNLNKRQYKIDLVLSKNIFLNIQKPISLQGTM
jgi:hypothetical protein